MTTILSAPLIVWAAALAVSLLVALYRHALSRSEAHAAAADGHDEHKGLARGALHALLGNGLENAFTLLLAKALLDLLGLLALGVYLLDRELPTWGILLTIVVGVALALLLPFAFYPVLRPHWRRVALVGAPPCFLAVFIATPLTGRLHKLLQAIVGQAETLPEVTTELSARFDRTFIPLSREVNPPDERELAMIYAILGMEETAIRDIMVPRPDVQGVSVDATMAGALGVMREVGHSRLIVYDGDIDHVVGVLHARDLLTLAQNPAAADELSIRDTMRPAHFEPEGKRVDQMLLEFQRRRQHLAIVVDEYGGTAGIVTLEDILEEIVGDIVDEFNKEEEEIQVISSDEVVLDARVNLGFLKEHFLVDLEGDGFDTMGGLVYNRLGRIPRQGDQIVVDGLRVEVLRVSGRRINRVLVSRR